MTFKITMKEIWAVVFAVAGFLIYIGQRATVNGVVQYDYNFAAVVCGAIAVVIAGLGAYTLKGDIGEQPPMPHYGLLGIVALVGIYHVLNGASII